MSMCFPVENSGLIMPSIFSKVLILQIFSIAEQPRLGLLLIFANTYVEISFNCCFPQDSCILAIKTVHCLETNFCFISYILVSV